MNFPNLYDMQFELIELQELAGLHLLIVELLKNKFYNRVKNISK